MYNSQEIANRIKDRAKQKHISVNQLLHNCELGKNTVAKMASGTDILTQNFAKIADYLDCSVDYLLGRTDNPEINRTDKQMLKEDKYSLNKTISDDIVNELKQDAIKSITSTK